MLIKIESRKTADLRGSKIEKRIQVEKKSERNLIFLNFFSLKLAFSKS